MLLLQSCRKLLQTSSSIYLPLISYKVTKLNYKLNTEVFSDLSYSQIANPRLTKLLITKPIHMHSRVSQRSLYHKKRVGGIIRSCFSEKKHKQFRRVQKIKRSFYSNVLDKNIFVTLSRKAFRSINKMGSFDNYILCTKPQDLDSKYGQYLRELMLRKINDPEFRIPYIIGTNRTLKIKSYRKKLFIQSQKRMTIPKQYREKYHTLQRRFGTIPEQLNNADYSKYLQLESLKKSLGDQLEPTHPLLVQLKQKLNKSTTTKQEQQKLKQMSKQAEENFFKNPRHQSQDIKKRFEKAAHEMQMINLKLVELRFKMSSINFGQEEEKQKQAKKQSAQKLEKQTKQVMKQAKDQKKSNEQKQKKKSGQKVQKKGKEAKQSKQGQKKKGKGKQK